jgi:hypothetical protein
MILVRWCNILGSLLWFWLEDSWFYECNVCWWSNELHNIMVVCHVWAFKGEVQRRRYRSWSSNQGENPFGPPSVESIPPMNRRAKLTRCHACMWWRQEGEGESSLPRSTALVMPFSHCGSIFIWMKMAFAWWSFNSRKEFMPLSRVWYTYHSVQDL